MSRTVWDELVATALVGTARRPLPTAVARHVEQALGAPLAGSVGEGADAVERTVLVAAGVMGAELRTGVPTQVVDAPPPPPAPEDERPEAPAGAVQLLELLLGGAAGLAGAGGTATTAAVVAEWLDRAASTGRRVPRRLLPALVALATSTPDLRAPLVAAGGPAVPWLAARNPSWSWVATTAVGHDPAGVWRTGTGEARVAALEAVRAADPAAGRALLEDTWAGERAADRARALRVLTRGLGPEDEPWLEAALDDRAASVRAAAAEVLDHLPSSARAGRMVDRLRPLVSVSGRLRRTLVVSLPEEPDAAARRDGIADAGAPPGTGRRAWWLTQIVAGAPLPLWTDELGLSPGTTADLAQSQPELVQGLVAATIRQGDPTWAAALAGHRPAPELLAVLPAPAALDLVTRALRRAEDAAVPGLLGAAPGPWPAPFTAAVVGRLRAVRNTVALQLALGTVALRGHPDAGDALEAWMGDLADAETRRRLVRPVAHTLSIRRAITQELP